MMSEKALPLEEAYFHDLMSFLVSSAYEMTQGEQHEEYYPAFRLMDGAIRLAKFILQSGGYEDDEWLQEFVQQGEKGLYLMGVDDDAFQAFLEDATLTLALEMKKRIEIE